MASTGRRAEPQVIGNFNEIDTTDHLVAAWMNSTNCFGPDPAMATFHSNAWIADATGHVFGESDLSGPPANNFGDASGLPLNKPIVGMTPTSDGAGILACCLRRRDLHLRRGAGFYGSAGSINLNQPVAGMAVARRRPWLHIGRH